MGKFRSWILNLPDFPLDSLHALPRESRRAYVLFAFLSHGFIRGAAAATEEEQIVERLPDKLGIPFKSISDSIGMKPAISYAAACLFNWRRIDANAPVSPFNLAINSTFTGNLDERWFFLVPLRIELL